MVNFPLPPVQCRGCDKHPDAIREYQDEAAAEDCTPAQFVRNEEGTYNPTTGQFWCTACYIQAGMPLGTA